MPTTLPQASSDDALVAARRSGRIVGCRVNGLGVDCPYLFDIIDLRHSWFAGFSEGRALLREVLIAE